MAENTENFWVNHKSLPVNTHIRKVLQGHQRILKELLIQPKEITNFTSIPVLHWLQSCSQKDPKIPFYCGGITLDEQARINNFFHEFIAKGTNLHPSQWELPLAHCRTLLIADCYQSEFLDMEVMNLRVRCIMTHRR